MSGEKTSLSLCMIARDAERSLAVALQSARPFMDEIVMVDTGSCDATRRIAEEHGARVFSFPWCDSFSAARNHSLTQATGDWIFWMDADDVLPPASGRELRRLIHGCPGRNAAFWATVQQAKPAQNGRRTRLTAHGHVRLFPRRDEIRFRYRVHEKVAPVITELGLPIRASEVIVWHRGDRSPAAREARRQRNLRLALMDQAEHPHDPFVLLSLGLTHLNLPGALPAATEYFRQSVEACPRGAQIQLPAYLYLGRALALARNQSEEERTYRDALTVFKDDATLLSRLGLLCEKSGRIAEAITIYRTVLARGRVRPSAQRRADDHMRIALQLGQLLIQIGQRLRAEQLWRDYLQRYPKAIPIQKSLQASYFATVTFTIGGK